VALVTSAALVAASIISATPAGAAPTNDNLGAATVIRGRSGTASGTTTGSTSETSETSETNETDYDDDGTAASVWYSWSAPASGQVQFDTCTGTTYDSILAVYTGAAIASLAYVAGNDEGRTTRGGANRQSRIAFAATVGTTYRIQVDGFRGATGAFTLTWAVPAAPSNDAFNDNTISGSTGSSPAPTLAPPAKRPSPTMPAAARSVPSGTAGWRRPTAMSPSATAPTSSSTQRWASTPEAP